MKKRLFYFAIYMVVVSLVSITNGLSNLLLLLNSVLGIVASIFLFLDKKPGFVLSVIWSALQIPLIQVFSYSVPVFIFDLFQFLKIHFYFSFTTMTGGYLFGINFVGIILLVLLFYLKKKDDAVRPVKKSKKK